MTDAPIIILGFGRSGTTWISDIVSKVLGKLVLFEPLHPSVNEESRHYSYASCVDGQGMAPYLRRVLAKEHRRPWLMRNHVPVPLKDIDPSFVDLLWDQCEIAGFKEIRANFVIPWLAQTLSRRIVFIVRDPFAVVASIRRRLNFWEFGWPGTYELLVDRNLANQAYDSIPAIPALREQAKRIDSDVERIALMWAITHAVALDDMERLGLPVFHYEDFYLSPFETTRRMFAHLGHGSPHIHPAHIFTPSMTTHKTLHGFYEFDRRIEVRNLDFFWREVLNEADQAAIRRIVAPLNLQHLYGHLA
ncbi:MAG: sulfotransferase [Magnetospirillum sp. WYHS-4]